MIFFYRILTLLMHKYQMNIYSNYKKRYNIKDSFRFNGKDILFYGDGEINLGENSYIGDYSTIQATEGTKVVVVIIALLVTM